ncbi:MAG: HD domain-containing phosphohydrolase [bacterium]|nr:HD domain-containing phosphohydrolase [bacterium]
MNLNIEETNKLISQLSVNEIKSLFIFKSIMKHSTQRYMDKLKKILSESLSLYNDSDDCFMETVISIIDIMDSINSGSQGRPERISRYALLLLDNIRNDILERITVINVNYRKLLKLTAFLYDIGMIYVPKDILLKKELLSENDWNIIKEHPSVGASFFDHIEELEEVALGIKFHHERFDGYGYPDRLANDNIPLSSRILAVCDAFDTLTNDRPYRNKLSKYQAFEEIESCSGTQFDPKIVKALENSLGKIELN